MKSSRFLTLISNPARALAFLLVLWVSVQVFLFFYFGVRHSVDTPLYVENAEGMIALSMPEGYGIWYSSYSAFLAVIFILGGNFTHVALVQILISGLATICLYKGVHKIGGNLTAFISTFLYIAWLKIHEWDAFIYTESLFTSFCIFSFYILVNTSKKSLWIAVLVLFVTFLIRPTGIGILFSLLAYLAVLNKHTFRLDSSRTLLAAAILSLIGLLVLNKMLYNYVDWFIEGYAKAELIYPNISLGLRPADQLFIPEPDSIPLVKLILFIANNPGYFIKLSTIKLMLFFGAIKPYFSTLHNIAIVLILYPIYAFAIIGYRKFSVSHQAERSFITAFIFFQGLIVMLTSENWDGRFLIPVLPYIFILAAFGIKAAALPLLQNAYYPISSANNLAHKNRLSNNDTDPVSPDVI